MPKRTMPLKTTTLDLSDDGYDGFHVETRLNTPPRLLRRYVGLLQGGLDSEDEARAILLEMFPSWDFVDDVGRAIPHTVKGFEEIPADLVGAMLRRRTEALREAAMPAPLGSDSSTTESPPPTDFPTSSEGSESGQPTPSGQ